MIRDSLKYMNSYKFLVILLVIGAVLIIYYMDKDEVIKKLVTIVSISDSEIELKSSNV